MKSFKLSGVNAIGNTVKLSKDVVAFTGNADYFRVVRNKGSVKVITPKGCYNLVKHPTLGIYTGKCGSTKVHVSLKKVVGELRYW